MRDLRIYTILLVLCTFFCSCERIENPDDLKSKEVKLFARMGVHLSTSGQTKGTITSTTDVEMNIGVLRLDEDSKGEENYFVNCGSAPLTAIVGNPDPEEGYLRSVSNFSEPQFFKDPTKKIWYTAWYPWPEGWTSENKQGYEYSSGENGTVITFPIPNTGDTDIMYSNIVEGEMQNGFEVMKFNHALSLFRVYAYCSSSSLDWGEITQLQLTGLPNTCTITLPKNESNPNHTIEYSGDGNTMSVSSVFDIPMGFENKSFIKEWIAAPATLQSGTKVLNITVTTANGGEGTVGSHDIAIARNFEPGYSYDIILRFTDEGTVNAEVLIEEWIDNNEDINSNVETSSTFYNLSANGTANCYIVSSANFNYCFDATIKGNGNISAMPGARIDPYISPETVKVIWSDNSELWSAEGNGSNKFHLETNKIVEGKVLFKIIGNTADISDKTLKSEGNVLLGVYDAGNNCLWTWHIWITDKPQKQNYTKGYIALDRNLGAIAPAPENSSSNGMQGLFYQWGRPTPFMLYEDNGIKKVHARKDESRVSPDEAVANPDKFYGKDITENNMTYNDWVDREQFMYVNNLWGYREQEHQQPIKTLYDPCPHGYHVPYARNWEELEKYWENKPSEDAWPPAYGINLQIEGADIWYPFQGYIKKDGTYSAGHVHIGNDNSVEYDEITQIVEVWSALINRHDENDTQGIDERINDSPYRFLFTKDYGAMLSDKYTNRSRGLAVRCVSNNTADVVKDLSASQSANCYMIHEDGYYKFKTTIRGNGVGSLLPLGGTTTAEINGGLSTTISPAVVDVLWWQGDFTQGTTDFPTDENEKIRDSAPENMRISLLDNGIIGNDGYVGFQVTGFKKGNVILAAYNNEEKDQILWTWHLWFTDKPADVRSGNYTKMDRFLGATFAPNCANKPITWGEGEKQATLGFYYQWGRKDPLIGPPNYNSGNDNTATTSSETVASSGWWKKENDGKWHYYVSIPAKDKASIPDVVKDPTAFYRSTSRQAATTSQWFPESFADGYTNVALWGYAVADYSINGQTFSKTMHDPCPPGYRTPFHFSWRYNSQYKYAEGDEGEATTTLTNAEKGYDNNGIVTNKEPYFEKMWFPFAGYRNPLTGGYQEVGTTGYMNTGMPMGRYNTRTFWYNNNYTGQHADSGNNGYGSAYGMMVRCMKE